MTSIKYITEFVVYKLKYIVRSRARKSVKLLNASQSVEYIKQSGCSLSRYGDGELNMVFNYLDKCDSRKSGFQRFDSELGRRLYDILKTGGAENTNFMVALPGCMLSVGTSYLRRYAAAFWHEYSYKYLFRLLSIIPGDKVYLDTNFSRFYLSHKNKNGCAKYIKMVKQIWHDRNIIIVEGNRTCLGVGNDLFAGTKSIKRVICPATDAWDSYDKILSTIRARVNPADKPLILCALGMTATVLAYDLAQDGYQAIDIGHIDIEYEWFLMGATEKVAVPGKFTNENKMGKHVEQCTDSTYISQIIARV